MSLWVAFVLKINSLALSFIRCANSMQRRPHEQISIFTSNLKGFEAHMNCGGGIRGLLTMTFWYHIHNSTQVLHAQQTLMAIWCFINSFRLQDTGAKIRKEWPMSTYFLVWCQKREWFRGLQGKTVVNRMETIFHGQTAPGALRGLPSGQRCQ